MLDGIGRSGTLAISAGTALLVCLAIVVVVGSLITAALARGTVIEAFSVPQDFAGRGLSGQVLASRLADHIAAMQQGTMRNPNGSVQTTPPDIPLKVEISSTTITLDEIYVYLRSWIGHETFVSGELTNLAPSPSAAAPPLLRLTARVGGGPACSAKGADVEDLLAKVADCVFQGIDPYRYAAYLTTVSTTPAALHRAKNIYRQLISYGARADRALSYGALGYLAQHNGLEFDERVDVAADGENDRIALDYYKQALDNKPNAILILRDIVEAQSDLGHDEEAYQGTVHLLTRLDRHWSLDISDDKARALRIELTAANDDALGDYSGAAALRRRIILDTPSDERRDETQSDYIEDLAFAHDGAALILMQNLKDWQGNDNPMEVDGKVLVYWGLERWPDIIAIQRDNKAAAACVSSCSPATYPMLAQAYANQGDFKDADAVLSAHPVLRDCYACLRAEAEVESLRGHFDAAERLYRAAIVLAPSIPLAYAEMARTYLRGRDPKQALATLALASQKGPHFADPLELWGEALIAQNRSDLALAKFEEAARYAPNWGRLHLKWGEALWWLGREEDARKQFAIAASLFLTPAEAARRAHFFPKG